MSGRRLQEGDNDATAEQGCVCGTHHDADGAAISRHAVAMKRVGGDEPTVQIEQHVAFSEANPQPERLAELDGTGDHVCGAVGHALRVPLALSIPLRMRLAIEQQLKSQAPKRAAKRLVKGGGQAAHERVELVIALGLVRVLPQRHMRQARSGDILARAEHMHGAVRALHLLRKQHVDMVMIA